MSSPANASRVAASTVSVAISAVGGMYFYSVVAVRMSTTGVSLLVVAVATVVLASAIARLGVDRSVVADLVSASLGQRSRLWSKYVRRTALAGAVVGAAAGLVVPPDLPVDRLTIVLLVATAVAIENLLWLTSEALRALDHEWLAAFVGPGARLLFAGLVLTGYRLGPTATFALYVATGGVLCSSGALVLFRSARHHRDRVDRGRVRLARQWGFAVAGVAGAMVNNLDVLLLSWLHGDEGDIAVYGIALRVSFLFSLPSVVASRTMVVGLTQRDEALRRSVAHARTLSRLASAAIALGLVGLMVLGNRTLTSVFGEEFRDATVLIIVFGIGHLIAAATGVCGQFAVSKGHAHLMAIGALVGIAIAVPGYVWFARSGNLFWMAFTSSGAVVATNLALLTGIVSTDRLNTAIFGPIDGTGRESIEHARQ